MTDPTQEIWALSVPKKQIVTGRGRLAGLKAFEAAVPKETVALLRGNSAIRNFAEGSSQAVHYSGVVLSIIKVPS